MVVQVLRVELRRERHSRSRDPHTILWTPVVSILDEVHVLQPANTVG
jgi:hypothetical protein